MLINKLIAVQRYAKLLKYNKKIQIPNDFVVLINKFKLNHKEHKVLHKVAESNNKL
jgi:hypothetical protein